MTGERNARSFIQRFPPSVWAWLAVLIGPLCLFGPGLIEGRVLFWGTPILQFFPWRQFGFAALRGGHIPLWNPLVGLGAPLLANYQSALLYPPNWIQALVGVAWGQGLLVMLHLVWAGAGMIFLARRLGMSWLAGAVAGVAFSLSGYLVARGEFLSINASVAWLPWIVASVDRLAVPDPASGDRKVQKSTYPLAVAAFTCQWLAGHAQVAWYSLLLAAVWTMWRAFESNAERAWSKAAARLAAVLGVSFCLAAPQLLPTLEYMAHSQRATAVSRDLAMTYSFWPWRLIGLLAPGLFGSPVSGDYWGYGNYWEDAIYVGVLPICLAGSAAWQALRGRRARAPLGRFLIGLCLVSLLLALGKNTPVFPLLYDHVPTFALFQAPARWTLWLVFGLCLLGGIGVDHWGTVSGKGLYWLRLGTAGAAAITLGAAVATLALHGIRPTFIRAVSFAGLWLVAVGGLALTRRPAPGTIWSVAAAGIVVLDLTIAGWGLNPFGPASLYAPALGLAQRLPEGSRLYMAPDVEYAFKYRAAFRFDTFSPDLDMRAVTAKGLPNTPMASGLASVNNFDPILPARFKTWMDAVFAMPTGQQAGWLDAMDVGLAASSSTAEGLPVYARLEPGGRAWFVGSAVAVASPETALAMASGPGFDPARQVILEGTDGEHPQARPGEGRARLIATGDPNTLRIATQNQDGGWLVISAMHYPGWQAELDGASARLYPADYALMALWVPAGDHVVDLSYRCLPFSVGLVLAAVALFMSAGLWVWKWGRA